MCKMLFIGTKEKLEEIPFNVEIPNIYIEAINEEYKAVGDKFENKNIYFVGTSRGCSCDFGIEKDFKIQEISELEIERKIRKEKSVIITIRKLLGTRENHIKEKIEKTKKIIAQEQSYFKQSIRLIEIIKLNSKEENFVEMYCCWAGEYSEQIEEFKTINLSEQKIENYFEIELRGKVKFIN